MDIALEILNTAIDQNWEEADSQNLLYEIDNLLNLYHFCRRPGDTLLGPCDSNMVSYSHTLSMRYRSHDRMF